MRFLLLGLVGSTITAQNATAWRWHRHSSEGSFVMSEVPLLPTSTDANRRLYGKTTVLRDTVYSLCTLRDTPGGSSVVLSLPPSVNLNLSGTVADGRQIALLTAYTTQGAFLWAAFFFADNADVGGADFIVDTLRQSLFVALAISAPTGPLSNLRAGYINGGLLTLSGIIGTIPTAAAAVVKVKGIGRPTPLFYAANWIQETTGNSSIFWASPYALVLQGEWIFLSGTFQLTNTGGYRAGHPPTLGVGSSDPTYPLAPTYYAFVMQFDTFALYGGHALIVRSHALPRAAYGRNLFRSGNNLIWLFSAEGPVLYYDWRDNTTGGANSFPLPYPGGIMKVLAWNLDAEDLSPSNTGQAILSYAYGMAGEQAPPVFHSAWSGDTLTLLWSDSLDYQPIGGPFGAGGNRLHFGQWIHAAGQLTFHRYHFTPLYPHGQVPVALSLTGEGSERLFWTGTFSPAVPNALILTASSYAPLSPTNSARGYLAGLHWRAGSSEPRLTGLHPLWGGLTGGGRILWTGLDRDTYGHFYGWGFGSDTFLVWPTYPAGRDTAKGFGADRQNRYWVGRLDWYRLSSPTTLGSHCAPNIFGSPGMHTCYGSFPKDSAYIAVWMPEEVSRRYPLAHHWQAIGAWGIRWSSDIENPWHAPPFYALLGRVPSGRYFLTAVCGGPYLPDFVDVLDTVWMTVPGSTTPYLYEKNPDRLHFVSRLIGSEDPAYPLAHTGVYPMRQVRFEGNIVALASVPWQPFSGESFSEMLYLLEETTDSVRLYRANLTDQTLRVIRRWWRFTGVVTGSRDYGLDTVLAANTGGNIPAPYQLVWNPFSGRLLLGERSARIRAIDVYSANDEIVLGAQSGTSGTNSIGYRRRGGFRPFLGGVFTLNAEGQMRLFARNGVRTGLFQLTPDIRDSLLLRVGGNTLPGSPPCNGSGTQAQIGTILAASISRDTVWFVDRFSSGCGTPNRLLLRRAYPSSVDPRRDIVETWDTLAPSGSVQSLFYRPLPEPHFIISGNSVVIRYHIATRRIDTLWQCAAPSCCKYGISTASSALGVYLAPLRGGSWAAANGGKTISLLSPLYCPTENRDTLLPESPLGNATGAFSQTANGEVEVQLPSQIGMDTARGRLIESPCGTGHSFLFYSYRLPSISVQIVAPDTVCETMIFHSHHKVDTSGTGYPGEEGCPVVWSLPALVPSTGRSHLMENRLLGVSRWRAQTVGYDTLRISIPPRLRCFFSRPVYEHPLRIRPAHRLRLRIHTEGPWRPLRGNLQRHPLLSRWQLIRYALAYPEVSGDSLWRLPYLKGDTLLWSWFTPVDLSHGCIANPGMSCVDLLQPYFAAIARVELRESRTGPPVDSLYVLIDSMGRAYPFWASAYPFTNQDTLLFCHCDVSTPKWVVVRFPHHLPLRSSSPLSLPTTPGSAFSLDFRDPSSLDGIPGLHYALIADSTLSPPRMRAAAWAGNCADLHNAFIAGPHHDIGVINAADLEFMLPRQGTTGPNAYSWADLDNDGAVTAQDALLLLRNQNALRQSIVRE